MPFVKGQIANPYGRPRVGQTLADALRRRFPPERVVDIAERLTESDDERVRMIALQFIADRGYGKLVEIPVEPGGGEVIDVSHIPLEERRQMLTTMTRMSALAAPPVGDGTEH